VGVDGADDRVLGEVAHDFLVSLVVSAHLPPASDDVGEGFCIFWR
jgi:hypothetical protein